MRRSFATGVHWTEKGKKSENYPKLCSRANLDVVKHFVVVLFFWAVQQFARYKKVTKNGPKRK